MVAKTLKTKPMTDREKSRIVELWHKGFQVSDLAQRFDRGKTLIRKILKEHGIKPIQRNAWGKYEDDEQF